MPSSQETDGFPYIPQIYFTDATNGAVVANWNWSFGDANNSSGTGAATSFNYGNAGTYEVSLVVTSNYGCMDSTTKTVIVDDEYMVYVPNAFSPNYDGVNDMFSAKGEGINDFKMYIFDRWGNQVFFTDDIDKGWDGTMRSGGGEVLQEDLYIWKIELRTFKKEPKQLKGTVSLIK